MTTPTAPRMAAARQWLTGAVWGLGVLTALGALAQTAAAPTAAELYQGADLAQGVQLIREHRCNECHSRKLGGDGSAIYRPQGRINSPGALRGMVDQCSLELKLALFPDETTSIAAVLNRDHYRFK